MGPGARKLIWTCTGVKPGEKVLVLTDTARSPLIGEAVYEAAVEAGADTVKIVMEPGAYPGAEVTEIVAAAMKVSDVIIGLTTSSIYHTRARLAACEGGSRLVAVTEVTEKIMISGGIEADFEAQRPIVADLARQISQAREVRLTTPGGTDLRAQTGGRAACEFTGLAQEKGQAVGVPTIEVALCPLEGTSQGWIVVDASATYLGLMKDPIHILVRDGRAVEISGGEEARRLRKLLEKEQDHNCWNMAEIAVGLNPCSRVIGKIIEDEGTFGTCHVALGNNVTLGGNNPARLHVDLVMWRPTLYLNGKETFTAEPSFKG
jgi:leucyl aminopeptidase (aminopeptidase T)